MIKSSTPVSTISSVDTNNTTTTSNAAQSGPYTKAQFQNTMEGSRSVKNAKEVEQLLRDYPAALELYRTGKYKVKVKYEADIERVILVEKRSTKVVPNNETKTNSVQQNYQSRPTLSTDSERRKQEVITEKDSERSCNRAESQDHTVPVTSVTDNSSSVNATTSSMPTIVNTQPKTDLHSAASKEQKIPEPSQTQEPQQEEQEEQKKEKHHSDRRTRSRNSPSNVLQLKHKEKKSSRDHRGVLVPLMTNGTQTQHMWQSPQGVQHYFSQPAVRQQTQPSNMYMAPPHPLRQNSAFQQPYYYGQTPLPAITYQQRSAYPLSSTNTLLGNGTSSTVNSINNYSASSKSKHNSNMAATVNTSYPTFYPNQPQYLPPQPIYPSHVPYQMPIQWPTVAHRRARPVLNDDNIPIETRRTSKHRAHSVDTGPRSQPPINYHNQPQQPARPVIVESHHHHHHRHHRSQPTNAPINPVGPSNSNTISTVDNGTNGSERLTIRQLNEMFFNTEPSGRLPYGTLPNILQRFGIALTESELTSAAIDLAYNVNEPISARRLVHVLVKLGKISKSTNQQQQQQQPTASPVMLPEDREVIDIMTQSRSIGTASAHPNNWH
ncbi:unnamed protein product [Rotaria magnacalcarata]|uniref:Uncharacterized protein n=1 Tax=Rotaria magnacalcarata TaxID=392030 RepID=A0A816BEX0_9BILA|nr:unnamed protein product [Rotaria magnacalcarata]